MKKEDASHEVLIRRVKDYTQGAQCPFTKARPSYFRRSQL
jgi:hypothetical protein